MEDLRSDTHEFWSVARRGEGRSLARARALTLPGKQRLESRARRDRTTYRLVGKRALDLAVVLASLPFTLPVILLCACALWLEGGNPFYRQQRLGRHGREFSILKLRTMVSDADAVLEDHLARNQAMRQEWDRFQKLREDPRVTRIGKLLRATSLDELPQLWNVLTGDMSLVGPRPMMPEQLALYGDPAAYFALRPGITGSWQISARNDDAFSQRMILDADYERQLSFTTDLAVMIRTVGVMARRTGC